MRAVYTISSHGMILYKVYLSEYYVKILIVGRMYKELKMSCLHEHDILHLHDIAVLLSYIYAKVPGSIASLY